MARVTYELKKNYVELGCIGCSEVYLAAEQKWLAAHYPGHKIVEHYTASDFINGASYKPDPNIHGGYSCWVLITSEGSRRDQCFWDSEWCREPRR